MNITLERKAEKIARRICREQGIPEGLWQLVLTEAYEEIFEQEERDEPTT